MADFAEKIGVAEIEIDHVWVDGERAFKILRISGVANEATLGTIS